MTFCSCCYPDRTGDLRSVTKISDFYSARQWHSTGMYRDTVRLAGVEHQLALRCPLAPGGSPGLGRPCGRSSAAGPGLTFPNVTGRSSRCCVPTCTAPTSTRNGAATPRLS